MSNPLLLRDFQIRWHRGQSDRGNVRLAASEDVHGRNDRRVDTTRHLRLILRMRHIPVEDLVEEVEIVLHQSTEQ